MKVDVGLWAELPDTVARAKELEAIGYNGMYVPETGHDPFVPMALVAEHTQHIQLRTGVAVAFPRSPTHLAMVANDLHTLSKGRFQLGLGSQTKAHNERRFGVPWSRPTHRMRELILAIRAIWRCWNQGERLDFQGEFYKLNLMSPFFSPAPSEYGTPPILLGTLGPRMTEVAGEVADGVLLHGLSSPRYIREVSMPALERGLAKAGRSRDEIEFVFPSIVAVGDTDEEMDKAVAKLKAHLAFYASTPDYKMVLELHGWGDVRERLHRLSREGRWEEMGDLITEEMLDVLSVRGTTDNMAGRILERVGGLADRVSFYSSETLSAERTKHIVDQLKKAKSRAELQAEHTA